MDPEVLHQAPWIAVATALGFLALAFVLLYPVWRFLNREEEISRHWTPDELARSAQRPPAAGDGASEDAELSPAEPGGR